MRAAKAHGNAETLRRADGDIGAHRGGRSHQQQREQIAADCGDGTLPVQCGYGRRPVEHPALRVGRLQMRTEILACGCIGFLRDTIARRRDDQGQNVIPGILNWLELSDVVALVAPRPLASVAGESDPIWPADGARAVFDAAAAAYGRLGVPERLVFLAEPGGHRFRPAPSWAALAAAGFLDARAAPQ